MTIAVRPMPSEIRYIAEGLQLRDVQPDGRYVEARACRFDTPNDVGPFIETLDPGVFDGTLARHATNIPMVLGHDDSVPAIARSTEWRKSPTELVGIFRFGTQDEAKRAVNLIEERMLTSVSTAFLPGKKPGDNVWQMVNGVPHVRRNHARLVHIGLVTAPADAEAEILAIRSLGVPDELIMRTPRLDSAREILARLRESRPQVP
jgi:HK97 family phage prohead protease